MNRSLEIVSEHCIHGHMEVTSTGRGNCTLQFDLDGVNVSIESSQTRLISAGAGPRTHFASNSGACEFTRQGDRLQITIIQWRGGTERFEMSADQFVQALQNLTATVEPPKPFVL